MSRVRRIFVVTLAALLPCGGAAVESFTLSSPDLKPGQTIPEAQVYRGYGCQGGNRSPALRWSHAPQGTRGFAVTMYDPDAPTGHGWWHWLVVDLPAQTAELPAGAGDASGRGLPPGSRQLRNDFGERAYGGPCPPKGDKPHRYVFTVHALKSARLSVPDDASPAELEAQLERESLAQASITAYYGR
jgi:Raf kinase inhibitor-like YbhB/YbcL family protein